MRAARHLNRLATLYALAKENLATLAFVCDLAFFTRFQPFGTQVRLRAHHPLTMHIKLKVLAQGTTLDNLTPGLEGQLRPQNAF